MISSLKAVCGFAYLVNVKAGCIFNQFSVNKTGTYNYTEVMLPLGFHLNTRRHLSTDICLACTCES